MRAVLLYLLASLIVAATSYFQIGMIAGCCALGISLVSVLCAGILKHQLLWSDVQQSLFSPAAVMTVLVLVNSLLAPRFWINVHGRVFSGTIWVIVGVVVGFTFVTQDMSY